MRNATKAWRSGLLLLVGVFLVGTAYGQRTVTLTLNSATIPDTTNTDSFMEVRGAVNGIAPITLADGNVIDWSDASTIEPANIGGDYWWVQFQIADTTNLTFKFYSEQANAVPNLDGWEADPNPTIPPGTGDTTLATHFFESQNEWQGVSGDRGPYDWRPFASMEGYVGVWFRVFMNTEEGVLDGYTPSFEPPGQQIGVRGDNLNSGGPLDWGDTKITLDRESTDAGVAGYYLYSGVAYYPDSLIGNTQAYKFVLDDNVLNDGELGWEDGTGDRTFTIPENDTTLHWVFFGNTPAASGEQPVESSIIFNVDMQPLADIGLFSQARGDTVWVLGDFNSWGDCITQTPDQCELLSVAGTNEFENAFTLSRIAGSSIPYKYFIDFRDDEFCLAFDCVGPGQGMPPSGWEEAHVLNNRIFEFEGTAQQFLEPVFFNDIKPGNIIPDGVSIDVTFSVDMSPADTNDAQPFNAATDSVYIQLEDPLWAFTQGDSLGLGPDDDRPDVLMSDDDQDGVYTLTKTVSGPTYGVINYRYQYGTGGMLFAEPGGGIGEPGRYHVEVIHPNPDGSWPATWEADLITFSLGGPLGGDPNTVAVEPVGGELPTTVTLARNYPNPFTETTTFEYTVSDRSHVTLSVYNILGQKVATLVDGIQAANTYRVNFDAEKMAAGTYFYRLETPKTVLTRSMVLVK